MLFLDAQSMERIFHCLLSIDLLYQRAATASWSSEEFQNQNHNVKWAPEGNNLPDFFLPLCNTSANFSPRSKAVTLSFHLLWWTPVAHVRKKNELLQNCNYVFISWQHTGNWDISLPIIVSFFDSVNVEQDAERTSTSGLYLQYYSWERNCPREDLVLSPCYTHMQKNHTEYEPWIRMMISSS